MTAIPGLGSVRLRTRAVRNFDVKVSLVCLVVSVMALAVTGIGADYAAGAFLDYVLGSLAIGLVPGLLLVLLFLPQRRLGLLEVLALGVAISMSLAGLITIASLSLHIAVAAMARALPASCAVLSLAILGHGILLQKQGRTRPATRVYSVNLDPLVLGLIVLTLVIIYFTSPPKPVSLTEDVLHMSIVKRVAVTEAPGIDNTFCCPGALYSYPFPSLHYFIAMVTSLSKLDPIFVYQKSRLFWSLASCLAFFAAARLFFRSNVIAYFAIIVGLILIYNGTMALVPGFYWGQLTPTSHNSDVAMNTLLPLAVMLLLYFVDAGRRREAVFFGMMLVSLFLTIGLAHPREIIQLVVYICVFLLTFLVIRFDRQRAVRSAISLGLIVLVFGSYLLWLRSTQSVISGIVHSRLEPKIQAIKGFGLFDWFSLSTNTQHFVGVLPTIFFLLFPALLIASLATVYLFRHRPYVVAAGMIILAFLLIVRFPILAAPYVLATYHEMLVSPVRNYVFFLYLLGGGAAYALYRFAAGGQSGLAQPDRQHLVIAALVSGVAGVFVRFAYPLLLQISSIFILGMIVLFGGLLLWIALLRSGRGIMPPGTGVLGSHPLSVRGRSLSILALICAIAPAALISAVPAESPVTALFRPNSWTTPARAIEAFYGDQLIRIGAPGGQALDAQGCLAPRDEQIWLPQYGDVTLRFPGVRSCAPSPALEQWLREHLGPSDVLAVNIFNQWWHLPFIESRVTYWSFGFLDPWHLFEDYFDAGRDTLLERNEQPLFGPSEPMTDKLHAIQSLGITHILLDPDVYEGVIDQYRGAEGQFSILFDDKGWAVIAVEQG